MVTFLFTEIEESARHWDEHPEEMQGVLDRHDEILRNAIQTCGGSIFKSGGGIFCGAFQKAGNAVLAATSAQHSLHREEWTSVGKIGVRMALHTGEAQMRQGDYFGPDLNRAARILAVAHGGQTLLSQATCKLVQHLLPDGASLLDLGVHRLRDLAVPEHVFQLICSGLPKNFPPLLSLESFAHNLPVQLTTFVGRRREMQEVKDLLKSARLLTLTGAGGCGKTRLALQVAAEMIEKQPDGTWVVELASLADPGLFPQAVANTLGIREIQNHPLLQTLVEQLESKNLLLILDDCEHMLQSCAQLSEKLLLNCPNIKILATSREQLGVAGEVTWVVPSLSLPDPQPGLPLEKALQSDAVQLFVERASAASPRFALTAHNRSHVLEILSRLDGIPLAIELAAAEVRMLSAEQIAQRLANRFRLLTGGSRTALPRHRTLKALIDWSYDYLPKEEQAVFIRLSAFAGTFTALAASHVCSTDGVEASRVPAILDHLATKSLLVREKTEGREQFRFLESIRHYGSEKLFESGESVRVRNKHFDFFLKFAEEAESHLSRSDQGVWLAELEAEHDNLRAALDWCQSDESGIEKGIRLAASLSLFWYYRGYLREGRERLTLSLARVKQTSEPVIAKATHGAGILAMNQGDYEQAAIFLNRSLDLFRVLEDRRGLSHALNSMGLLMASQGEYAKARVTLEEALSHFRETDDRQGVAISLDNLGSVVLKLGEPQTAQALCEESLAASQSFGDKRSIGISHHHLGNLFLKQRDCSLAQIHFNKALTLRTELGDKQGISISLEGFASLALLKGDPRRAARLFGGAQTLRKAIGAPLPAGERAEREQQLAMLRQKLGEEQFAKVFAEGGGFKLEELIAYASG